MARRTDVEGTFLALAGNVALREERDMARSGAEDTLDRELLSKDLQECRG